MKLEDTLKLFIDRLSTWNLNAQNRTQTPLSPISSLHLKAIYLRHSHTLIMDISVL